MKAWQQAARSALQRGFEGRVPERAGTVERMTIDVAGASGPELVSLRMRGAELSWSCTCGVAGCEHAHAALALLAEAPARVSSVPPAAAPGSVAGAIPAPAIATAAAAAAAAASAARESIATTPADGLAQGGDRRTLPAPEPRSGFDRRALAETLDDVLVAITRSGVAAKRSASVGDALVRLRSAAPAPLPLALDRWLGRLEQALAVADTDDVALLLAGASQLIEDLRAPGTNGEREMRLQAWLGSARRAHDGPRLTDRTLLEIAREQLAGAQRASIERRHLIDVDSGQVYREERVQGGDPTSLGPCPRLLTVWLATLEPGPPPARVHVLQYTATPAIDADVWERLAQHAQRDFAALAERYRAEIAPFPGSSEPFALVAPAKGQTVSEGALFDDAGRALALSAPDGSHSLRALALESAGSELLWVCGRLYARSGELALHAAGAAVRRQARVHYVQL
jgi:hypothetical protein